MSLSPQDYLDKIKTIYIALGNPEIAQGQIAYMKNHFDFYGIKAPVWQATLKTIFKESGILLGDDLKEFVRLSFDDPQRELHMAAIEMVQIGLKKQPEDFIYFLGEMIQMKSWWDSVDWIAKLVGIHFEKYPYLLKPVTEGWMNSGNMWLQRSAIICQRFYKSKTNTDILFDYILRLADSKEFFIQKGAGWALREYSKVNPQAVLDFVAAHSLAPLTRREATRLIP